MKQKSPLQLLIAICEQGSANTICELLSQHNEHFSLVSLASGTSPSSTASLFGFGVLEREVVFSVVKSLHADSLVQDIASNMEQTQHSQRGVVFTVDFSSAEKTFLDACLKGEENGKKQS